MSLTSESILKPSKTWRLRMRLSSNTPSTCITLRYAWAISITLTSSAVCKRHRLTVLATSMRGLMQKICAIRLPKDDIEHVGLTNSTGSRLATTPTSLGGISVAMRCESRTLGMASWQSWIFVRSSRSRFMSSKLAEFLSWQWKWGSFAAVPVSMAKVHFPTLFNKRKQW